MAEKQTAMHGMSRGMLSGLTAVVDAMPDAKVELGEDELCLVHGGAGATGQPAGTEQAVLFHELVHAAHG